MPGPHVNESLVDLNVDLKVNLGIVVANFPVIGLKKPDGSFLTRDYGAGASQLLRATITDVSNGKILLQFLAGELNQAGTWTGQTRADFTDGGRAHGDEFTFSVAANLTNWAGGNP